MLSRMLLAALFAVPPLIHAPGGEAARWRADWGHPQELAAARPDAMAHTHAHAWRLVASLGPGTVESLLLSDRWPDEPVVVAVQQPLTGAFTGGSRKISASGDAGATWHPGPTGSPSRITIAPGGAVYALVQGADPWSPGQSLHRWSPAGMVWEALLTGASYFRPSPLFAEHSVAFAVAGDRLLRTADVGATWQPVLGGMTETLGLELSPAFATDGIVLASFGGVVHRSGDGGVTWQEVLPAGGDLEPGTFFTFSDAFQTDGVVFTHAFFVAGGRWVRGYRYRSADGGATWQRLPPDTNGLRFAPTYAADGLVFASVGGALQRSRDRGATWDTLPLPVPVDLATPQLPNADRTAQLQFSPAFGPDRTVALALRGEGQDAHMHSPGLLVSRDGGDTWTSAAAGLEVDGVPYRRVLNVTFSPEYARDGTLFAAAAGPVGGGGGAPSCRLNPTETTLRHAALFRSRDGVATWQPVMTERDLCGPNGLRYNALGAARGGLWLSPAFASDGIGIMSWSYTGPSSVSGGCVVALSHDGGATWTTERVNATFERCSVFRLPYPNELFALHHTFSGFPGPSRERAFLARAAEGGWEPWQPLAPPQAGTPATTVAAPSPAVARDRTIFFGTPAGEIWSLTLDPPGT